MVAHPNASRDISESTGRGRAAHPPIRAGRRGAGAASRGWSDGCAGSAPAPARPHPHCGVRRVCTGSGAAAPARPMGAWFSGVRFRRELEHAECGVASSFRAYRDYFTAAERIFIARREGNLTFHPKIPSIRCGFRKNPSLTAVGREEEGRGAGGAGWRRERSGIRRGDRASVVQNASGRALAQQGIRDEHKHDRQHEDARKHERQPPEP